MLTILDLVVVARVGFGAHIPWWLWAWAIVNELCAGYMQNIIKKAAEAIIKDKP